MKHFKVEWVDSHSTHGWGYLSEDTQTVFPCTSVGYLVSEDKECMKLVMTISDNIDYVHTILTIPKCSIKKVRELK
jgi:hypothetical protein